MHITLESDYAIRIVQILACANNRMDAKTIAEETCVTRPAKEISLKDVVEAVEGEYKLSRCLAEDYVCTRGRSGNCRIQDAVNEVSDVVRDKLAEYTFDKLM